jgi:TusE/DsrC/DsvC family sulfur relay protein
MTMTMKTYDGVDVELDDEGFFLDPSRWTEAMAEEIAAAEGIAELTDRHWEVVKFMRRQYEEKGEAPNVRALAKTCGIPIKELYQLFPKGPAKLAAKIAGVPKPRGCI